MRMLIIHYMCLIIMIIMIIITFDNDHIIHTILLKFIKYIYIYMFI